MWGLAKKAINSTVGIGMKPLDKISEHISAELLYTLALVINTSIPNNKIFIAPRNKILSGSLPDVSLQIAIIPPEVEVISEGFFYDCRDLEDIDISFVKAIRAEAFRDSALKRVVLGTNLEGIERFAFSGCFSLTDIYYRGTMEQWTNVYRDDDWDVDTPEYIVHCLDGDIPK